MVGFKEHLRAEVVPGEGVFLFSERGNRLIDSRELEALAPLLTEHRELPALLSAVSPHLPPERVGYLLRQLAEARLVEHRVPDGADQAEPAGATAPGRMARAFWELAGIDGRQACARTAGGRIRLTAVGDADVQAVYTALDHGGFEVVGPDAPPADDPSTELSAVVCTDYLDPALALVDAAHRASGRPWLLARPWGADVWVGPVLRPGEPDSPCWSCLAHRLWGQRDVEARVQRALGRRGPAPVRPSHIPASSGLGAQLLALEAAKWLAGHRDTGQDAVLTMDCFTLQTRHHQVRRRPQCPECGDPGLVAARDRRPLPLRPCPKAVQQGPGCAGDRAIGIGEMLVRYNHLISPVTGVVRAVEPDPDAPADCHVYRAGFNLALAGASPGEARQGLRSLSSGKGMTAEHAKVSALGEALERYSGVFTGEEAVVHGSYQQLRARGEDPLEPNACQLYHPRQYRDREAWNRAHGVFQYICEPFAPDVPLDWTPVWSLDGTRRRLLPTALLYFDGPNPVGRSFARADSNGCAAGGSLEDAVVQGFLELVERDATAIWWYNRTRQPAVCAEAFDTPWTLRQRQLHAQMNREIWMLDLTADLGIPVFAALSRRTDKPAEDIVLGLGAHFDPQTAMRRAIAELNQMVPFVGSARADGSGYNCSDPELLDWCRTATTAGHPYLLPDPGVPARTPADYPYTPRPDLLEDISSIGRLAADHGLDVLVLDQTRPDIGLPVVRVIVPGLRHFWARFGEGRLYDVPVRLGRLTRPNRYEDLNPVPIFF